MAGQGRSARRATLRRGLLHVETPLGIVNIRAGLADAEGRPVDSVEIIPTATEDGVRAVVEGQHPSGTSLRVIGYRVPS